MSQVVSSEPGSRLHVPLSPWPVTPHAPANGNGAEPDGVAVIMPAYREERNLAPTVTDFLRVLDAHAQRDEGQQDGATNHQVKGLRGSRLGGHDGTRRRRAALRTESRAVRHLAPTVSAVAHKALLGILPIGGILHQAPSRRLKAAQ